MIDADKYADKIDELEKFRDEAFQFAVDNTASSSFPAVAALPTLLVRKRVPATVEIGRASCRERV